MWEEKDYSGVEKRMVVKGGKIRALREQRGYTLQELSRRARLSLSYLSEIERGSKKPSLKTLEKIAKALNVAKTQLLEEVPANHGFSPGEKIRLLRTEKNISLQELAEKAGLSASYLSEIERGTVYPSLATLGRIAYSLGVPAGSLLGREASLGYKLKVLREEQGLTQTHLAQLVGVTPGLIGQIEQGKVQPSLKTLEKISEAMGVSPCYFIIEASSLEQILSTLTPELREMLLHPNVQSVLALICDLSEKELQFILNFIQLYKRSGISN